MYIVMDDAGRIVELDHPINILSGLAVGPLGTPGQVLAVSPDGQNLVWSTGGGGGGTVTGSGAANQVAFWTAASVLSGGSAMTWDTKTLTLTPVAAAAGGSALVVVGAAHTAEVAEVIDVSLNLSRTVTFTHGSAPAEQKAFSIQAPTYTNSSLTDTLANAGTLVIDNAPLTSGGLTITNSYALWVKNGTTFLNGITNGGSGVANSGQYKQVAAPVGTASTAFSVTGGANTGVVAESQDALFNLARTVTFTHSSVPATQRAMLIQAPTYATSSSTDTITTAATLAITAAPTAGTGITITNPYTLWVQAGGVLLAGGLNLGTASGATVGQLLSIGTTQDSLQFVVDGGSAGLNLTTYRTNSNGSRLNIKTARGTLAAPTKTLLNDILFDIIVQGYEEVTPGFTTQTVIWMYRATEDFTATAQGSQIRMSTIPNGTISPVTAIVVGQDQSLTVTGAVVGAAATFSGLVSANAALVATVTDAGTNTQPVVMQQYHHYNAALASVANGFGSSFAFQADTTTTAQQTQATLLTSWTVAAHATRTGRFSIFISDNTGQAEALQIVANGSGAAMIGFLGAAAVVRPTATTDLRAALINLGLYTTGGATPLDLNGGAFTAATASLSGKLTTYNAVATVGNGVGSIVATIDATAQAAAIATATLYAVPAAGVGLYRISWYAKITRNATTSSQMGALTISWTDATDSTAAAFTVTALASTGGTSTSNVSNVTGSSGAMIGVPVTVWAKASTNIQYAMAYASVGATTMQYELHIKVEWLG